jgi:hypothetical protein
MTTRVQRRRRALEDVVLVALLLCRRRVRLLEQGLSLRRKLSELGGVRSLLVIGELRALCCGLQLAEGGSIEGSV